MVQAEVVPVLHSALTQGAPVLQLAHTDGVPVSGKIMKYLRKMSTFWCIKSGRGNHFAVMCNPRNKCAFGKKLTYEVLKIELERLRVITHMSMPTDVK